jgi:hypothetical protein
MDDLLKYYMKNTDDKLDKIESSIDEMRKDITQLMELRWKISGVSMFSGVILIVIFEIGKILLEKSI